MFVDLVLGEERLGGKTELTTPWVAQAGGDRVGVMPGLPVFLGRPYMCGPAVTFECSRNDNLGLHEALYRADPGCVLIGSGGGTKAFGLFGELMATDAVVRGLAGLVVEGTVRDLADLDRIGFPVACSGSAPAQCAKKTMVSVGLPVTIGEVLVRSGDQIVADRDGVVVVPTSLWDEVREAALAIARREEGYLKRLRFGERVGDVLGIVVSDRTR